MNLYMNTLYSTCSCGLQFPYKGYKQLWCYRTWSSHLGWKWWTISQKYCREIVRGVRTSSVEGGGNRWGGGVEEEDGEEWGANEGQQQFPQIPCFAVMIHHLICIVFKLHVFVYHRVLTFDLCWTRIRPRVSSCSFLTLWLVWFIMSDVINCS